MTPRGDGGPHALFGRTLRRSSVFPARGAGLRKGVFWRDMGVINLASGQASLSLTGGASRHLAALTPGRFHGASQNGIPWVQFPARTVYLLEEL